VSLFAEGDIESVRIHVDLMYALCSKFYEPSGSSRHLSCGCTTVTYASSSLEFDIVSLLLNRLALFCNMIMPVSDVTTT
jgi:hypothetical protein